MEKTDYKLVHKSLYQASHKAVTTVDVPEMNFLMIDGRGDPNTSPEYADAIEALFAVAYAIKFMVKKGSEATDYGVMPLEGLWWVDDMSRFSIEDKSDWQWTMMIMQPPVVTETRVQQALAEVQAKKSLPALPLIRFAPYAEGPSAQILHVGPFSEEGPAIERVHQHIAANGHLHGKHHEIYLSDIRRAAPEKWKTIIRQPM